MMMIRRRGTTFILLATTTTTSVIDAFTFIRPKLSSLISTTRSSYTMKSSSSLNYKTNIARSFASSLSSSSLHAVQTKNEIQMSKDALSITQAAIHAVDPNVAIEKHLVYNQEDKTLTVEDTTTKYRHIYKLEDGTYDTILISAFGKAATDMALKTVQIVSKANIPTKGIVITKYDHATEGQINELKSFNIDLHFAAHPVPDQQSITSSNLLLDMVRSNATSKTLVLNCISGGGSSLFCTPRPPITLETMAQVNAQLLACGMPIQQMNVIRKKLEIGKGGGLVGLIQPATSVTLVLSDVIGDPLDLIASGPTVPDQSTWLDAWESIERYDMNKGGKYALPDDVIEILMKGKEGYYDNVEDLPTNDHLMFSSHCENAVSEASKLSETVLIANNAQAVHAAAEKAKQLGYNPVILGTTIEGEARHVGNMYVSMAHQTQLQRTNPNAAYFPLVKLPAALIAGGETTVTLSKNHGLGGRNQELGLAAALSLQASNLRDVVISSIGTDGGDGPTDAAGATVDATTIERIETENGGSMSGKDALEQNNAYNFFASAPESSALVKTGPTGTNVADICVTLIN